MHLSSLCPLCSSSIASVLNPAFFCSLLSCIFQHKNVRVSHPCSSLLLSLLFCFIASLLQNLFHRRKRILLPPSHLRRQPPQSFLSALLAQYLLEQPRLQH